MNREPGTASRLAALLTCAIMLVALAVYASYHPVEGQIVPPGIEPSMATATFTADSFGQKLAHKVLLLGTATAVLAAIRIGGRFAPGPVLSRAMDAAIVVGGGGFFLLAARFHWRTDDHGYPSILNGHGLLFGALGTGLLVVATTHAFRRRLRPLHLVALAGGAAAVTLPGFVASIDLSHSANVPIIQTHFAIVVTAGDRLAAGLPLFDLVMPQYGVALPSLAAAFERHVRPLSFYDYFLAIRLTQTLYLVATALLYWRYTRGKVEHLLLPLAASLALFNFNHAGLITPNQTTWRLMGLPFGLAGLFLLRDWRFERAALGLGALGAALLLINAETGVSLCVGLAAYAFFRFRLFESAARIAVLVILSVVGFVMMLATFLVFFRIGVGTWPAIARMGRIFEFLYVWESTGLGGTKMPFDPYVVVMAAHSIFVLLDTALRIRRNRAVSFRQSFLAAVATTILIWLAYYVNRPSDWSLRSFHLLYGFLLIDLLKQIPASSLRNRRVRARQVAALLIVSVVVIPKLCLLGIWAEGELREGVEVIRHGAAPGACRVSGVYISPAQAAEVTEKAAFIKERASRERLVYLTVSTVFIPKLSGVEQSLPAGETWVVTTKEYDALLARIRELDPEVIYFDAPTCCIKGPPTEIEYYEKMKKDLAGAYERGAPLHGWEPWRRKRRPR